MEAVMCDELEAIANAYHAKRPVLGAEPVRAALSEAWQALNDEVCEHWVGLARSRLEDLRWELHAAIASASIELGTVAAPLIRLGLGALAAVQAEVEAAERGIGARRAGERAR